MNKRLLIVAVVVGVGAIALIGAVFLGSDRQEDTIVLNTVEEYADAAICPDTAESAVLDSGTLTQGEIADAWDTMLERQERMRPPEELGELHAALLVWNEEQARYMTRDEITDEERAALKGRDSWADAFDALPQETQDFINQHCDQRRGR